MCGFAGVGRVEVMMHYFLQVPSVYGTIALQQATLGWM